MIVFKFLLNRIPEIRSWWWWRFKTVLTVAIFFLISNWVFPGCVTRGTNLGVVFNTLKLGEVPSRSCFRRTTLGCRPISQKNRWLPKGWRRSTDLDLGSWYVSWGRSKEDLGKGTSYSKGDLNLDWSKLSLTVPLASCWTKSSSGFLTGFWSCKG